MARRPPPENPFHAGTIVTGDDFADRQDEVALLRDELRQGGRVFLLAYRRFGKSCLIHETLRQLDVHDRALTAYVDLYRANSERELWGLFANALLTASRSSVTRPVEWVTEAPRGERSISLSSCRPVAPGVGPPRPAASDGRRGPEPRGSGSAGGPASPANGGPTGQANARMTARAPAARPGR